MVTWITHCGDHEARGRRRKEVGSMLKKLIAAGLVVEIMMFVTLFSMAYIIF